jgi:hypothetical protein
MKVNGEKIFSHKCPVLYMTVYSYNTKRTVMVLFCMHKTHLRTKVVIQGIAFIIATLHLQPNDVPCHDDKDAFYMDIMVPSHIKYISFYSHKN